MQISQGSDGAKGGASKTNTILTMKKKKEENKEMKLFLNKEKLRLLLKLWQVRRPNWRRKVQFSPLERRVARKVRIVRNCKAHISYIAPLEYITSATS